MTTFGLYQPGNSLIHRTPAAVKLGALVTISLLGTIWRTPALNLGLLALSLVLLTAARISWVATLRSLRYVLITLFLLTVYHLWANGAERAISITAGLLGVIVTASVVTATTRTDELIDGLTKALEPLRRFGLHPERFALTVSLVLRTVPATLDLATDTAQAARARGLDNSLRARLVPFVIRVVARARVTGEALAARGVGED